jgi:cytochrome c-type biogenesis protein
MLVLLGLGAAWSWLFAVSRWGPAARVDILTFKAGLTSQVMRTLLQPAQRSGHHGHDAASLSGIYATPEYFALTEQAREAARLLPDRFVVFYLFEDIHIGELPTSPPPVWLQTDDGRELAPFDSSVVRDSVHHRATVLRFANTDRQGNPTIGATTSSVSLVAREPSWHGAQVMQWKLPVVYPDVSERSDLSVATLLALVMGLLAVLSPCLLQLTVYYTAALAGISLGRTQAEVTAARPRIMRTALAFMVGFCLVFTAAGALAGLAGERLQASGVVDRWNRPLAVAAGTGIVLLGIWMGVNSVAPRFCRVPWLADPVGPRGWMDSLKMMAMGSAFAVGCSTCFGGALFISLMIYVGAVGSASIGALALCLLSFGMTVPYLLSAFFFARAVPLLGAFRRIMPAVGLTCSAVLVFFGIVLMTDRFHIPSNLLYRFYLGF